MYLVYIAFPLSYKKKLKFIPTQGGVCFLPQPYVTRRIILCLGSWLNPMWIKTSCLFSFPSCAVTLFPTVINVSHCALPCSVLSWPIIGALTFFFLAITGCFHILGRHPWCLLPLRTPKVYPRIFSKCIPSQSLFWQAGWDQLWHLNFWHQALAKGWWQRWPPNYGNWFYPGGW